MRTPTVNSPPQSNPRQAPLRKAPQGQKNIAHGVSRGNASGNNKAPRGRKKPPAPTSELHIIPLPLDAEINPGDSITNLLLDALKFQPLLRGDILVIKHKIISKAEGQLFHLQTVRPFAASRRWAKPYDLDARVIESPSPKAVASYAANAASL